MIQVGSNEVTDIRVGSLQTIQVNVGSTQVWPTGYYYTLTYKRTTYSSGTKLFTSANNYATFICDYKKYRRNGTLVSTEEVTAIPSAYYCVNYDTQLRFDRSTYGTTQLAENPSVSVDLSYQGATTTGTVAIAANTYSYYATITPIVVTNNSVGASGGSMTYTGGDYTTTRRWTSGDEEAYATGTATFTNPAQNSSVSSVYGYIISNNKTIVLPSLANNTTGGQTHYDFTSESYGDNHATASITIYQAQNSMHQTSGYYVWDVDNNKAFEQNITVPKTPAGYIKFQVRKVTSTTWDSGYEGGVSTDTLNHSSYTYQNVPYMNGGCITSIGYWDSNYTLQANYSANTGNTSRVSGIICTSQSPSFTIALTVTQPS